MNRYKRLLLAPLMAFVMIGISGQGRAQGEPGSEPPGFHGMLLFGTERIYMSHLPMFMAQHRYQGVWEVSLGETADRAYREARARPEHAGTIFTLAPTENFRLPDLTGTRESFPAQVVVGHFDQGHPLFVEGASFGPVTVTLQRAVHWLPLLVEDQRPQDLTYVVAGEGDERFLVHWISSAPNYDQVVALEPAAALGALAPGAQLVVLDRDDDRPLRAGETVKGLVIDRQRADGPVRVRGTEIGVRAEIYLERAELEFTRPPFVLVQ